MASGTMRHPESMCEPHSCIRKGKANLSPSTGTCQVSSRLEYVCCTDLVEPCPRTMASQSRSCMQSRIAHRACWRHFELG